MIKKKYSKLENVCFPWYNYDGSALRWVTCGISRSIYGIDAMLLFLCGVHRESSAHQHQLTT